MPEISRFLGIVISMYYDEHNPPHFHAEYGNYKVSVEIKSGATHGTFPKKFLNKILEWKDIHKNELLQDWERASKKAKLKKIKPL